MFPAAAPKAFFTGPIAMKMISNNKRMSMVGVMLISEESTRPLRKVEETSDLVSLRQKKHFQHVAEANRRHAGALNILERD
jgi:hypothetical protein